MNKNPYKSTTVAAKKQSPTFPTVPLEEVPMSYMNSEASSHRPSVLVVDDESVIADTLAEILNRNGYAARPAYDGEAALEAALLMPPELLISDVVLPGMNGIDLAITMKSIFPGCRVILFSGRASTSDLLASAGSRGHQFSLLTKPVHPTDLLSRVMSSFAAGRQHAAVNAI